VRRFRLEHPLRGGGTARHDRGRNCQGNKADPCERTVDLPVTAWGAAGAPITINAVDLPDGQVNATLTVSDALAGAGHDAANTKVLKIDRTPPTLTGFPGAVRPDAALRAGLHSLVVEGDDTGAGGVTNSGIARFEYSVDSGNWITAAKSCASGPCSHTFAVDTREGSGLPEGEHNIRVRAADNVGLESTIRSFTIVVDRTAPTLQLEGALKDKAGQELVDGVWLVDAEAVDDAQHRTAGVASVNAFVDGQPLRFEGEPFSSADEPCPEGNCDLDWEFVFDTQEYPEGPRSFSVKASDHAGNQAPEQVINFRSSRRDEPCSSPDFSAYHVGQAFEGLPMTEGTRLCSPPDPQSPELGRFDDVTYLYGECSVETGEAAEVEGGCLPPIQVQSSPICQKHASLYQSEYLQYPYESLTIKGVPAASFDGGTTIEIYAGDTTITVYGRDPAQVRRVAEDVRLALPADIPGYEQTLLGLPGTTSPPLALLPPPNPMILQQEEPC